MKTITFWMIATAFMFLATGCTQKNASPLATVPSVDLTRYSGLWYESARYENRFEKGCVGATAYYALKDDSIAVTNICYGDNASPIGRAEGDAHTTDQSGSKIKVSFFWPFYGDYWIFMLADDYRYSVVGDPKREYLWILSREPELSEHDRHEIITALPAFGYDAAKLYWTDPGIFNGDGRRKSITNKEL